MTTLGNNECDFHIYDDCNINSKSHTDLGKEYEAPNGYAPDSNEAKSYLAGSYYFYVEEIEVFRIF